MLMYKRIKEIKKFSMSKVIKLRELKGKVWKLKRLFLSTIKNIR